MRPIDADALTEVLETMAKNKWNQEVGSSKGLEDAIDVIENAPTVDVIPSEEGYEMYGKGYLQGYERCKSERPQGDLISRKALREDLRRFFPSEVLEGIEPKTLFAQIMHDIDNAPTVDRFIVTTTPVTLSDGWGHVREAYYDASRQLVFTEAITRESLIGRGINITEQTEQLRNMRGGEES